MYWAIFRKTLVSQSFYLGEVVLSNFAVMLQGIIAVFLGLYLNSQKTYFSADDLFLYYLCGIGVLNVVQRTHLIRRVEQDVLTGNISTLLARPFDLFAHYVARDIGERVGRVAVTVVVVYITIAVFFDPFVPSWAQVWRALLILPLTIGFIYLITGIWLCVALFVEKVQSLSRIFGMMSFYVGGGLAPTAYFPAFVSWLPTNFFYGAPLVYIVTGAYPLFWLFGVYFVVFALIFVILRRLALRRIELNG